MHLIHESQTEYPLHTAIKLYKPITEVKRLLNFGADVSTVDDDGLTPLHLAYKNDSIAIARLLTIHDSSHDKKKNPVDERGLSHFHLACTMGSKLQAVRTFLQNGVDVEAKIYGEPEMNEPLPEVLPVFGELRDGLAQVPIPVNNITRTNLQVSINSAEWARNYTALHLAVENRCVKIVDELIHHGANEMATTTLGMTPLHLCAVHFQEGIMSRLIESGAVIDAKCRRGLSPLYYALCQMQPEAVTVLLRHGADWYARDAHGDSVWCSDFMKWDDRVVSIFHKTVPTAFLRSEEGVKLLSKACHMVNLDLIRCLVVTFRVKVDFIEKHVWSPLHTLMIRLDFITDATIKDAVELLLDHGANASVRGPDGKTPLHVAVDKTISFSYSWTNVTETLWYGIVNDLIKRGYDVNLTDALGRTALHIASRAKNLVAVQSLIHMGADVNIEDNDGKTAIFYSANVRGHEPIMKLFTDHVLKMRLLNRPICLKNRMLLPDSLWSVNCNVRLESLCRKELEKMKNVVITVSPDDTMYLSNIIEGDRRLLHSVIDMRNLETTLALENVKREFPLCGYLVISIVEEFLAKKRAFDAREFFSFFFGLPDLCSEKIIQHLSDTDVKGLNQILANY